MVTTSLGHKAKVPKITKASFQSEFGTGLILIPSKGIRLETFQSTFRQQNFLRISWGIKLNVKLQYLPWAQTQTHFSLPKVSIQKSDLFPILGLSSICILSRPSVSMGDWFQHPQWIPKPEDTQVPYVKRCRICT